MNCIIIDDDISIRIILESLISQIDFLKCVAICSNAKEAYNILQSQKIDLIFLDIEMPEMNGISLLESLEKKPLVIICTSKKEYAINAFEHEAVDYILKPIQEQKFFHAVSKAQELFTSKTEINETTKDFIFIKENNLLIKINFQDILYIQAMGDYMKIYTLQKTYVLHATMRFLEEKLPKNIFFRLHRSYIINILNIDTIEDNVAYCNKKSIPIGDPYKQTLLKKLNYI